MYTPKLLGQAKRLHVVTLGSAVFINDGQGKFASQEAPDLSQLAPVMSVDVVDLDGDGNLDCLLGQNFYLAQRETGRDNGGLCLLLKGQGDGSFESVWPSESGISIRADVRDTAWVDLNGDGHPDWLIATNNDKPRVLLRKP